MKVRAIVLAFAVATTGCGAEAVLGPLIVLSNTWRDSNNAEHTFSFIDNTTAPSRSGTFTGNETTPGPNSVQFQLTGLWRENGSVEFTVQRPTGAVTYRGQLTSNLNRIEFTSSAGNLVLLRG